jgi:hypothetical protein
MAVLLDIVPSDHFISKSPKLPQEPVSGPTLYNAQLPQAIVTDILHSVIAATFLTTPC